MKNRNSGDKKLTHDSCVHSEFLRIETLANNAFKTIIFLFFKKPKAIDQV